MEERIYSMLVEKEELTWKDLLYDLIKKEGMSPWDVDVSRLTKRYIEKIKDFKKKDFKVSGNVILCAALLVKMKSQKLLGEDLDAFDRLVASREEQEDFYDELEQEYVGRGDRLTPEERMELIPRTPQPRERKVSIHDLVSALEKALEVKKRKVIRQMPELQIDLPEKKMDIFLVIKHVYRKILHILVGRKKKSLAFTDICETQTRKEIIGNFIPLLHLANDRKINLHQETTFGEIKIEVIEEERFKEPHQVTPET